MFYRIPIFPCFTEAKFSYRFWYLSITAPHQDCYHQILSCKLNSKNECLPPYARKVWGYGKTQTDIINGVIYQFDLVNLFLAGKNNEEVILFNGTILNIFHNFIPNKTRNAKRCNNRDDLLHLSFTLYNSIFSEAYI